MGGGLSAGTLSEKSGCSMKAFGRNPTAKQRATDTDGLTKKTRGEAGNKGKGAQPVQREKGGGGRRGTQRTARGGGEAEVESRGGRGGGDKSAAGSRRIQTTSLGGCGRAQIRHLLRQMFHRARSVSNWPNGSVRAEVFVFVFSRHPKPTARKGGSA